MIPEARGRSGMNLHLRLCRSALLAPDRGGGGGGGIGDESRSALIALSACSRAGRPSSSCLELECPFHPACPLCTESETANVNGSCGPSASAAGSAHYRSPLIGLSWLQSGQFRTGSPDDAPAGTLCP
jgi:hypothetical protein